MFHTRFFGLETEAHSAFQSTKDELGRILTSIPLVDDPDVKAKARAVEQAIARFIEEFP
jgi:hypothetical protein